MRTRNIFMRSRSPIGRRRTAAWLTATLLAAAQSVVTSPTAAQATGSGEQQVRDVVEGFKHALRSGDGEAAMSRLHPDVRIFEGGHAETRDQYGSGHLAGDMAFLGAVESVTTWSDLTVQGDMAVYLSEYTTRGEYRGREIDSHGTESMVLVRSSEGWLIRHIHWSSR